MSARQSQPQRFPAQLPSLHFVKQHKINRRLFQKRPRPPESQRFAPLSPPLPSLGCDRLAILESFCPKLADAATTRKWVEEAIAQLGATKPGDVGKARSPLQLRPRPCGVVILCVHRGPLRNDGF